jgi:hypothetical protein
MTIADRHLQARSARSSMPPKPERWQEQRLLETRALLPTMTMKTMLRAESFRTLRLSMVSCLASEMLAELTPLLGENLQLTFFRVRI